MVFEIFKKKKKEIPRAETWEYSVFLNHKKIDSVFFTGNVSEEEVEESLINHDNYDRNINVIKSKRIR
jgi:hypothetical protein